MSSTVGAGLIGVGPFIGRVCLTAGIRRPSRPDTSSNGCSSGRLEPGMTRGNERQSDSRATQGRKWEESSNARSYYSRTSQMRWRIEVSAGFDRHARHVSEEVQMIKTPSDEHKYRDGPPIDEKDE